MPKPRPAVLALAAVAALTVSSCSSPGPSVTRTGARVIKAGTLTVCTAVPFAPFEMADSHTASGFAGFDIDIVTEIAKRLDLHLAIKSTSFDPLAGGATLAAGDCDIAASAMSINAQRKKHLAFSDGYYTTQQSLLVPSRSPITSLKDLEGKRVGVQAGTTGKEYAATNAPDAIAITYANDADAFSALQAGTVDALLEDLPTNLVHAKDGTYAVVQTYDTNEEYGIAAKPGNDQLITDIDGALQDMHEDGTYNTIYDRYFKAS
ncbi:ABC transporter substrate-binding protein [Nocardioides montaniterrae]